MKDYITASILIISLLTFQCWEYIKEVFCLEIFYIGYALCFLLCAIKIYLSSGKVDNFWSMMLVALTFNNFIDELMLDPEKETVVEVLLLPLLLFTIYKKYKNAKQLGD